MSLDIFLDREYDFNKYNCSHFVADVWKHLTGEYIGDICDAFVNSELDVYFNLFRQRKKLCIPETPCVVFMQADKVVPHAGIYIDGRVIHLTQQGAKFEDLCMLKVYYRLSYYK